MGICRHRQAARARGTRVGFGRYTIVQDVSLDAPPCRVSGSAGDRTGDALFDVGLDPGHGAGALGLPVPPRGLLEHVSGSLEMCFQSS